MTRDSPHFVLVDAHRYVCAMQTHGHQIPAVFHSPESLQHMGAFWVHFGCILYPKCTLMSTFRVHFGYILHPKCTSLGAFRVHFGYKKSPNHRKTRVFLTYVFFIGKAMSLHDSPTLMQPCLSRLKEKLSLETMSLLSGLSALPPLESDDGVRTRKTCKRPKPDDEPPTQPEEEQDNGEMGADDDDDDDEEEACDDEPPQRPVQRVCRKPAGRRARRAKARG